MRARRPRDAATASCLSRSQALMSPERRGVLTLGEAIPTGYHRSKGHRTAARSRASSGVRPLWPQLAVPRSSTLRNPTDLITTRRCG